MTGSRRVLPANRGTTGRRRPTARGALVVPVSSEEARAVIEARLAGFRLAAMHVGLMIPCYIDVFYPEVGSGAYLRVDSLEMPA